MSISQKAFRAMDCVLAPHKIMDHEGNDPYSGHFVRTITTPQVAITNIAGLAASTAAFCIWGSDAASGIMTAQAGSTAMFVWAIYDTKWEDESLHGADPTYNPPYFIDRTIKPMWPQIPENILTELKGNRIWGSVGAIAWGIPGSTAFVYMLNQIPESTSTNSKLFAVGAILTMAANIVTVPTITASSIAWRAHRVLTGQWKLLTERPKKSPKEVKVPIESHIAAVAIPLKKLSM